MADLLTLTWASDNEADQDTLNLLNFAQGLTLADSGWIPQVMQDGALTIVETFTFYASGLSHDDLATRLQVIDDWKRRVSWSSDPTQRRVVWLNARWKSETNTRRAMVHHLDYSIGDSPMGPFLRDSNFMPNVTFTIERGWWEELSILTVRTATLSTVGGASLIKDVGGINNQIVAGDAGARIIELQVSFGDGGNQRYYWIGLRSSYLGDLAKFRSIWELESSSWLKNTSHGEAIDDTVIENDASASGGEKIVINFTGGSSILPRARINAHDVTVGDFEDQRGMFNCLVRAKMNDASIARIRVNSGFFDTATASTYVINQRREVQGTSWFLYDAGIIRLPALDDKMSGMGTPPMRYAGIELDAELLSGSGDLEVDCFILIPINESYTRVDYGAAKSEVFIRTNPAERMYANAASFVIGELESTKWSIPANNEAPLMILAAQRNATHPLIDEVDVSAKIVRRWRTLRGTE